MECSPTPPGCPRTRTKAAQANAPSPSHQAAVPLATSTSRHANYVAAAKTPTQMSFDDNPFHIDSEDKDEQ